jgi:hypothetical protein
VTGAGLVFTFIAILIALLDVRLSGTRPVVGLDLLIQGLSGKFISSIAALGAATIYLIFEKPLFHRLTQSRQNLVASLDALFPVLSPSQLLSDLVRDISEQSTAFRSFNADLSQKLKQSFSESMGPTLIRMVSTVEDLNQLLRAAEAQKQESITGSLEGLLRRLETSIAGSLREMTTKFTESISTGARTEFAGVIESLRSSAGLLERMNAQFLTTQQALGELTELSRRATTEQIQLGQSQVENLTEVLRGLMTQLNETAGSSVTQMAATLTNVVHDLSARVTELGDKMTSSVIDSATLASGAASEVIQSANRWSAKSAEQLAELIKVHHGELDTVKGLREELEASLIGFRTAIREYGAVSAGLKNLVVSAEGSAAAIGGIAKSLRETQVSVERAAGLTATQVSHLADANRAQQQTWEQIQRNMEHYQQLFARVEKEAGALLSEIAKHLANYVEVSRDGFENLAKVSNEHFENATKRLGGTVGELEETLQELMEGFAKTRDGRGGGAG